MRKGILGVLAYSLTGLSMAHGQTGSIYQEPLPIPAPRAGFAPTAPGMARVPAYAPAGYGAPRFPAAYPHVPSPAASRMPWDGLAIRPTQLPMPAGWMPYPALPGAASSRLQAPAVVPVAGQGVKQDENPSRSPEPSAGHLPDPAKDGEGATEAPADDTPPLPPNLGDQGGGPPPEPAEPFLVGPEGNYKPMKGYTFYGSAEYLYWWLRSQPVPANLALSSSNTRTTLDLSDEAQHGGRFFLGVWINHRQDIALEAGYTHLFEKATTVSQNFPPSNLVIRPIFDGVVRDTGTISAATKFWSGEVNLRRIAWRYEEGECSGFFGFLGGFRFADLSEALAVGARAEFGTAPVLLSDTTMTTLDSFTTHNHFFAGQVGLDAGIGWGRFSLRSYAKLAMGDNRRSVVINGSTGVAGPPVLGSFTVPGGFYAQPNNSGSFREHVFAMLPEAGINLGAKLGERWRVAAGYSFLNFSNVARPGDQIDITAGGGRRPALFFLGGARPQPTFVDFGETSFWAQGINLSVEVSY